MYKKQFNITPHFCFIGGYNYQIVFNFVTANHKYGYTYFADGHGGVLEISIGAINYENISNQIQWFFDSPGVVFQITPSVTTEQIDVSDNSSAGAHYQLNVNTRNYIYLII